MCEHQFREERIDPSEPAMIEMNIVEEKEGLPGASELFGVIDMETLVHGECSGVADF